MAFLSAAELPNYYPNNMAVGDVTKYLGRANAYCYGVIGGEPPIVDENLKVIVSTAFEILAEGETSQTDNVTGIITEAGPASSYSREKGNNPLASIDKMLLPYKKAFDAANAEQADNGITWLGG
ncbi:hypothetical protein [Paenibacillus sp. L3-i20]|uniref:hypothetical protein n=1 Tax=Paenibacillus sp. L3-i20 TaxID=2905833 RepID=UPI001EE07261|nr:hypothetical protein [Paenibacillus sp. L3-i20]GKU79294.1 hypothetical protein L3i20_v236910 [Paenibacillus sp. L3-i20]